MDVLYGKLCGTRVIDLCFHLPTGVIDRTYSPTLRQAEKGRVATLKLRVVEHIPPARPAKPYRIVATDGTDEITLTYFNAKGEYLTSLYPVGSDLVVSGLLERYGRTWTMNHPDYVLAAEKAGDIPPLSRFIPLPKA